MALFERDGVKLFYEDTGQGDPPFVFIHGWTCDHTYFAPQAEHFSPRHRVVSVDLRGHGQSDAPEQDYAMSVFADDVAALVTDLGLTKPIVAGHSMGGVVALEMAARHPDLVGGVVMLDSPVLLPDALRPTLLGLIDGLKSPGYKDVQRSFVEGMLFSPTDDPTVKGRVLDEMGRAPQHVMASCFDGMAAWDAEAAAKACKVPALYVGAENVIADVARFKELCPQLMVGQTVGAGHFHQLLVPDQVNAMVERFTALSAV